MSFEIEQFDLLAGGVKWLAAVISCALIGLFVASVVSFLAYGPRGFRRLWDGLKRGIVDLTCLSCRRIMAIASLAVRESMHRKALFVFAVFVPLFMFGGWFLQEDMLADKPAKPFIVFVLTAIRWLLVPVAILLACWGLPADIKDRSLHTVVTKPVRRSEVLIGRMLGYGFVTTIVLLIMSFVGWAFIRREVPVEARDQLISRVPVYASSIYYLDRMGQPPPPGERGGLNVGDIWEYRSYIEGQTNARVGLRFEGISEDSLALAPDAQEAVDALELLAEDSDDIPQSDRQVQEQILLDAVRKAERLGYAPSDPSPELQELLEFLQPDSVERTIVLEFSPQLMRELKAMLGQLKVLKLEYKFEAFRTHKGTIDEGVHFALELINEETGVRIPYPASSAGIEIREFAVGAEEAIIPIPTTLHADIDDDGEDEEIDLINDLVPDGNLLIEISCADGGQYLGVAQPDLFIRKMDRPFEAGYFKSMLAIWLMVQLIIIIGTAASCFLKGPVATFLTLGMVIMGGTGLRTFLIEQLQQYNTEGEVLGGGPLESTYRLVTAMNQQTELPENALTAAIKLLDPPILEGLDVLQHVIPNFNYYNSTKYVANGFDVPWSTIDAALLPGIATALAYLIPCIVLGYFSLQVRELEAK